jgi:hypothetical protein
VVRFVPSRRKERALNIVYKRTRDILSTTENGWGQIVIPLIGKNGILFLSFLSALKVDYSTKFSAKRLLQNKLYELFDTSVWEMRAGYGGKEYDHQVFKNAFG